VTLFIVICALDFAVQTGFSRFCDILYWQKRSLSRSALREWCDSNFGKNQWFRLP